MDVLSEVLSQLKLQSYVSGGFVLNATKGFEFDRHRGVKCYVLSSGSCWLTVQGEDPLHLTTGDCVLLARGLPFCLATSLSLPRIRFPQKEATRTPGERVLNEASEECSILGGHFLLTGGHAELLLSPLPSVMHIRKDRAKETMRWSLSCMREELCNPKPGGSLVGQQLATMILVQALRLYLQDDAGKSAGWLFALADPQISRSIKVMHTHPGYDWTLEELARELGMSRTVFSQKFRQKVGMTPMDYLTRWRMLLAGDRLKSNTDSVLAICSSLGYETESAFGRAFRRAWGCSPREHRRQAE